MKILICHNAYQLAGGEDAVVEAEIKLLESNRHDVSLYYVSNDQISSFQEKLKVALSASYSKRAYLAFKQKLLEVQPDVVHCHNIFPLLSPSIYDACVESGIPVVQTLHNYRNVCANALLLREGRSCDKCIQGSPYQSVKYKCYRDSYFQSAVVANMIAKHRRENTWNNKVTRFIALTEFAREKFISAGFDSDKLKVKPNFVPSAKKNSKASYPESRPFALFVGRLSKEKGIDVLLRVWEGLSHDLVIVGSGPLESYVKERVKSNIHFLGQKSSADVSQLMHDADFLIAPSQCYETFGMVIIEAYAQGTPVICPSPSAMAELVDEGITGLTFEINKESDLLDKIKLMISENHSGVNAEAVNRYQTLYSPETNYEKLLAIYKEAIDAVKS